MKLKFVQSSENKCDNHMKAIQEGIQAGISLAKGCYLITKYPGSVVAIYGQIDAPGKTDTVRVIPVEKEKKAEEPKEPEY